MTRRTGYMYIRISHLLAVLFFIWRNREARKSEILVKKITIASNRTLKVHKGYCIFFLISDDSNISLKLWSVTVCFCFAGERDPNKGVKCARSKMPSDCMRRRARTVPRSDGAVPHRRPIARHQLPVHGWLRGPRLLQRRDCHVARRPQGEHIISRIYRA